MAANKHRVAMIRKSYRDGIVKGFDSKRETDDFSYAP